ncbi:MAG: ISAs1 family transposase [Acetobacteraceae bacterium]
MDGFEACFAGLRDPRTGNAGRHDLLERLMIALSTVLCGAEDCADMVEHGVPSQDAFRACSVWLNTLYFDFSSGFTRRWIAPRFQSAAIRSSWLFRLLDPEQFRDCCQRCMAGFAEACQGVVMIDGKVLRRSFDEAGGRSALRMVSAWGSEQPLVLGRIAADAQSNAITAIPRVLKTRRLEGATVTVWALNCQREIGRQLIDQRGN